MIEIRKANIQDAEILALLGRITFIESHSDFVQNDDAVQTFCNTEFDVLKIREDVLDKNQLFWLIYSKGLPVGFARVILNKPNAILKSENVCKLDKIYILNDFINLKLGSKLHTTIIKEIQDLNFEYIWLVTYIYNYKAIKFYERNTYNKSGFIDFMVDGKGYKNHIMIKNLRK